MESLGSRQSTCSSILSGLGHCQYNHDKLRDGDMPAGALSMCASPTCLSKSCAPAYINMRALPVERTFRE